MDLYGEIHPQTIVRTGKNAWRCRRRFDCQSSDLVPYALENTLYGTVMPGFSGNYAPKCKRVERHTGFRPGRTLVVAYYETQRVPEQASVRFKIGYNSTKRRLDENGKVISGPDPDGVHVWKVVRGSDKLLEPTCMVIVETAYSSFDPNVVMNRVGHVNSADMPNVSTSAVAGSMLLLGTPYTKLWKEMGIWYANYAFAYSGTPKWNEGKTQSQMGCLIAKQSAVFDISGEVVTAQRKFIADFDFKKIMVQAGDPPTITGTADTTPENRVVFPEADFGELNGWIKW